MAVLQPFGLQRCIVPYLKDIIPICVSFFAGVDESNINVFLTEIVEKALRTLNESSCLEFDEDDRGLISTTFGRIASYYYLQHLTVQHFNDR